MRTQNFSRKPHRCCLLNLYRYIFSFCLRANLGKISSHFIIVRFPIGNLCKAKLNHYNEGGDNSGASQPHKHVQFIPVEDKDGPPLEKLARKAQIQFPGSSTTEILISLLKHFLGLDRPFSLTQLSYASHSYRFPSDIASSPPHELEGLMANAFLQILDLAISTIRHDPDYPAGKPSYNVIITLEHIHIIPRRQEHYVLAENGEKLSVNALGFAGMLLVKSDQELEIVKRESIGKILRGVGLESVHDIQVEGTAHEQPLAGML